MYPARKTAQVMDKFKVIVKRSFAQYVNELMNERFKSVLSAEKEEPATPASSAESASEEETSSTENAINTTPEEVEAFLIIKALLHDHVDPSRIKFKDTQSYFGILLDGKVTKWICRLQIEGKTKKIIFPGIDGGKETQAYILSNNDLFAHQEELIKSLQMYLG